MEKRYYIPHKKDTPEVSFDIETGEFTVMGISHPENISIFFNPVEQWLSKIKDEIAHKQMKAPKKIHLTFFFIYVNSASYKYMINLIGIMHGFTAYGTSIDITWCYEKGDSDMLSAGEELMEYMNLDMKFNTEERERPEEWEETIM